MRNEYRVVTFCQKSSELFGPEPGAVSSQTVDFLGSTPQLAEAMDGWEPIGFQMIPAGEVTYLAIMLKSENRAPDDASGLE